MALVGLNLVYLHILKTWGPARMSDRIEVMLEAPGSEAVEYLSAYVGFGDAKIIVYMAASVYLLLQSKQISLPARMRWSLVVTALSLLAAACVLRSSDLNAHSFSSLPLAYDEAQARRDRVAQRRTAIAQTLGQKLDCKENYKSILVVIGESATRNHMGLYGYKRGNTPFLESKGSYSFQAIAPSNQTRLSVPLMLSRATVRDFESFYTSPSIVTELQQCGFETHWISNQGNTGQNDSLNGSIGREARYSALRDNSVTSDPDEILIPKVKQALSGSREPKAVFVHLMGSHFVYGGRYPKNFPSGPIGDVVSEYDESIRYTDHVLSGLFDLFPQEGFLFVYVSDHGEVVRVAGPTENVEFHGHGFSPAYRDEFEIPLVAWSTQTERLQMVQSFVGKREINAESFDALLRYLVGMTDELLTVVRSEGA